MGDPNTALHVRPQAKDGIPAKLHGIVEVAARNREFILLEKVKSTDGGQSVRIYEEPNFMHTEYAVHPLLSTGNSYKIDKMLKVSKIEISLRFGFRAAPDEVDSSKV